MKESKEAVLNRARPDVFMNDKGFGRANKPSENLKDMLQQADLQTEEH
jgi:hypothetical protein